MSRQLPNEQIEAYLRDTASALPYPPTPDIAGAVWQRLVKQGVHATAYRRPPRTRRVVAAIALSLALTLAVALAVPEGKPVAACELRRLGR